VGKYLNVVANSNTVLTDIEFFADAARTRLVYQALAKDAFTSAFVDGTPFALFDLAGGLELNTIYYRLTNDGANASTYNIALVVRS
jgi:hypothetical protein